LEWNKKIFKTEAKERLRKIFTTGKKMLRGVRFDHIGCAVRNVSDGFRLMRRLRGVALKGGNNQYFRGGQWLMPNKAVLELIEPIGPYSEENFLHRFLQKRGPGIHHITFIVPSIHEAMKRAADLGLEIVKYNDKKPHWKEAFLHPKQALGMLIQLAEYDPNLKVKGQAWDEHWEGFQGYPPKGEPEDERLLGIQGLNTFCKIENLAIADIIFRQLLGGELEQSLFPHLRPSRHYVYHWNDGPLTVALNIELYRGRTEGPYGIEMLVTRDYNEGPILLPEIGARFIPFLSEKYQHK
jgi:catechol 2,3-dioxygenase-like lactoylglutathione lyase family enzyme